MPRKMGNCATCGDEFIPVNKVRKYCTVCQGIRDVEYAPNRRVKCAICEGEFWPLKANYRICNDCREPNENESQYPACRGCSRHLRPAPGLNSFCMSCVQSSKEFRLRWLRAVKKVVQNRISGA